ncbi:NAD-dependent epimerase/dehydratase family protein [Modestobacter sp. I12A-02628]|uniref:NAD-dependent epimerase/dehydratase family protein n=1 Tax=Goekera deserti TaxID=2497753 RepID=A0A7K3WEP8_9ACTN|nr:NAD-dependent epimerase/dehydratase family protein [Goekera deserti]MPQ98417.1 NAD-dependent epimerase/dehydratase family protein [Goekera deserti]NDI48244.1 NAD-dependent epimerase/dehydratase family protein [Goekera deserti]NEL53993.1 NAD-dependent epimerase/dehydratase family protein [Goekera deserti]
MTSRLLVLGGTHFLGVHVVEAALARGHEVATFSRGVSGAPPPGARALHGDRDDPAALPAALDGWTPDLVVDTSAQTRAAADNAAAVLGGVSGYAFTSSLNAYRTWPPGPVPDEQSPTWDTPDDEYGPVKAHAERVLAAALPGRFLTARAGLVVGPHDRLYRLGWWLDRIAAGGRVVVPDALDQPIALVDARDLAGWLVQAAERGLAGPVNATGPAGMTTLGGLLDTCRTVTGSDAEWVPVPEDDLLAAGVQEWVHLPLWLRAETARTAWDVGTARARELGLPSRPLGDTVADTWAWQRSAPRPTPPAGRPLPGLPADLEARLLAG